MRLTVDAGQLEAKRALRTSRVDLATVNDVHLRKANVSLGDTAGRTLEVPLEALLSDPEVRRAVHEGLKAARVAGLVRGDEVNLVLARTSP